MPPDRTSKSQLGNLTIHDPFKIIFRMFHYVILFCYFDREKKQRGSIFASFDTTVTWAGGKTEWKILAATVVEPRLGARNNLYSSAVWQYVYHWIQGCLIFTSIAPTKWYVIGCYALRRGGGIGCVVLLLLLLLLLRVIDPHTAGAGNSQLGFWEPVPSNSVPAKRCTQARVSSSKARLGRLEPNLVL